MGEGRISGRFTCDGIGRLSGNADSVVVGPTPALSMTRTVMPRLPLGISTVKPPLFVFSTPPVAFATSSANELGDNSLDAVFAVFAATTVADANDDRASSSPRDCSRVGPVACALSAMVEGVS